MKIEHFGIKIEIPPMQFGNETDMQIRDKLHKLHELLKPKKVPVTKLEEKVKSIMNDINNLIKFKNKI